MAPKRDLLEDPPAASSSEEEEVEEDEEEVEEEEQEVDEEEEEEEEEEGDEEEEDDEEEEVTPGKPNSSSAVKKPISDLKTPSSDDDEEEEDESEESDSDPTPPKIKPLGPSSGSNPSSGKPIASEPKKTLSKPSTTIRASALASSPKPSATGKRPLESEKEDSKRKKKKVDDEDEEDEEDEEDSHPEESEKRSPKNLFQRLWSEDDEIVILRSMIESIKKGVNPLAGRSEFLESIKNSLHVEVNTDQLINKIRRLKKKYLNNVKRGKGRDPVFSKAHEVLSHELMKEIWGCEKEGSNIKGGVTRITSNGKDDSVLANGKSMSRKSKNAASPVRIKTLSDISMRESSKMDERNGSLHPCVQEMIHSGNNLNMVGGSFLKEGLGLIGDSKTNDLEQKWRSLYAAELKLYLRRVELVQEQTIAILDAYKSSDNTS